MTMTPLVENWLLQSAVLFLMAGSVAGLALGIALLLSPQWISRVGGILNRWVSTRHLDHSLERTVSLDPWFYRYRRTSGTFILLGACYIIYYFTVSMDRASVLNGVTKHFHWSASLVGGLLDALVLSALLGALCAAFVSLFLLLRPSLLREFEQSANQWLSLRQAMKPMEVPRAGVDEYILRHARRAGVLLVLGSLYALVLLTLWFGRYQGI